MIGLFSFFSGAGFLDLGFEKTNQYEILYVNEFKSEFDKIYKYSREQMHIKEPIYGHYVGDICRLTRSNNIVSVKRQINEARQEYELVGFVGGPPCPDFSVAGKNHGKEGDNGKLSGTYVDLICKAKPDFFVFENVKGLYRTSKHRAFFEDLKKELYLSGYFMTEQLINSIEFGVPQDRDRIILIGFRRNIVRRYHMLTKESEIIDFDWEANKKYSRDVFNLNWPKTSPYIENGQLAKPENIIEELTVEYCWKKNDVQHHPNANMFFKPKAGIARFQTKDEGDDKKKCYKRLHRWRYSPTAAYGNNEVHIHPYLPRRISVSEALAIQSLPKEYQIPLDVTLTDAFKTIGNGVPFLAAYGVAKNILDYLDKHRK